MEQINLLVTVDSVPIVEEQDSQSIGFRTFSSGQYSVTISVFSDVNTLASVKSINYEVNCP